MPKIKQCPHCKQILVCKACGMRTTPDLGGKKRLTTLVNEGVIRQLTEEARKEGVGINEYLKRRIKPALPASKNNRRRAGADQP